MNLRLFLSLSDSVDVDVCGPHHTNKQPGIPGIPGGARNFHLERTTAQGVWRQKFSVEVQGRSAGGSGERSPVEAEAVCMTLFTDFDCRKDQNLTISHNSPRFLISVFHGEASLQTQACRRHCKQPTAHLTSRTSRQCSVITLDLN